MNQQRESKLPGFGPKQQVGTGICLKPVVPFVIKFIRDDNRQSLKKHNMFVVQLAQQVPSLEVLYRILRLFNGVGIPFHKPYIQLI